MNTVNIVVPIVVALIAGLTAGGSAWLIARRSGSGRVDTSDARSVFEAQTQYMTRLADDNADLRQRMASLEQSEEECQARIRKLERQVDQLLSLRGDDQ